MLKKILTLFLSCGIALMEIAGNGTLVSRAETGAEAASGAQIVGAEPLGEDQQDIYLYERIDEEELKSRFPQTLEVTFGDGSRATVPVTWETAEDYAAGEVYYYVYDPVVVGYDLAGDAELPYIVVWIEDDSPVLFLSGDAGDPVTTEEVSGEQTQAGENGEGNPETTTTETTTTETTTTETTTTETPSTETTTTDTPAAETTEETHLQDLVRTDVTVDKSANEQEIYNYLRYEFGLNQAAAVGVLANINAESGYRQNALGDKQNGYYTSFGLCQWHNARWESLISYCDSIGEDWQSVHGQMKYLQYELENVSRFKKVIETLRTVENNEQGAYEAAYMFCYRFEVPANREQKSDSRGKVARDRFWPRFGGYTNDQGVTCIWKAENGKSYWYENDVRQGTVDDPQGVWGDNTIRGREIYDPLTDGWYWLDAAFDGAKAVNKEVWMPYIYSNEEGYDEATIAENAAQSVGMEEQVAAAIRLHGTLGAGKWVRYNSEGRMIKGWYTVGEEDAEYYPDQVGNTYYYDPKTGLMAKGRTVIDGKEYYFDETSGVLVP